MSCRNCKYIPLLAGLTLLPIFTALHAEDKANDCYQKSRENIAPPSIYISEVEQRGTRLEPRVRIKGFYEGVCLKEVGVFEDGRRIQKLRVTTSPSFKRYEFSALATIAKNPEIRAYTVHGDRAVAEIRPRRTSNLEIREIEIFIPNQTEPQVLPLKGSINK
jgi:hypothetical protein